MKRNILIREMPGDREMRQKVKKLIESMEMKVDREKVRKYVG